MSKWSKGWKIRQHTRVVVPFVTVVACSIGVIADAKKSSVPMSDQNLVAHHVLGHVLEAHGHFVSAKFVQRVDNKYVVVHIDAAVLH